MSRRPTKISTTVRIKVRYLLLRLSFALGSRFAPDATIRRAARLFCTPMQRRPAPDPASVGAAATMLDIDGQRVAAYVWGDPGRQPHVLFAHGWSSNGTRIASWVAPLRAAGYAVIAFDQAGHGRSAGKRTNLVEFACLLLAVNHRYGPAAAVIGHSLGGAAATVALANGLQARRAVIVAPPADPLLVADQFAGMVGMARHLARGMFALFERRMRFAVEDLQAQHVAPRIGRPALVVHDLEDREVPWSEGERYARYWHEARLLSTCGLGHHRIMDDAGVIDAALRFLHGATVGERVVSSPNLVYGFA